MAKRYALTAVVALAISATSTSQTLDNAGTSPIVGDVVDYHNVSYEAPTAPGTGQTWDRSSLTATTPSTTTYVTPASTGHAASFPGANLAASSGQGSYSFFNMSSAGFDLLGAYEPSGPVTIPYQNSERIISYPCSYGTTWTDPFSSNYTTGGFPTVRSGSITGDADATGTLIMPYGTVNNVIRIHTHEVFSDENDFYTIEYNYHNYYYFTPGIRAPIYATYDLVTTINGAPPQTSQMAIWTTSDAIGMADLVRNDIGIDIFPNPASDDVTVIFSSTGNSMQLELIESTGRLVRNETLAATALGIGRSTLSIDDLAPGAYLLRIISSDGEQGTRRLIVQ
jgi:hypothetical protein